MVCLTQDQNTASVQHRTTITKIRVSARERANTIAFFGCLATVLVKDCFGGGAVGIRLRFNKQKSQI